VNLSLKISLPVIPAKKEEEYSFIRPQEKDNTKQFSIANNQKL
jgi:hypothetical protein